MADKTRIPPHSDEAEGSVLGAILIDKNAIVQVAEFLRAEHFYKDENREIFEAMVELYEARDPIDVLTVSERLKTKKSPTKRASASYLTELVNLVPTSANVEAYATLVKDLAVRRSLIGAAGRIAEVSFDEGKTAAEALDRAEQEVFSLSQKNLRQVFMPVKEALAESFDRLDELHKRSGSLRGLSTGISDLDDCLAGMQDSNLLIIASRPGGGKTSLALNIAQHAAVKDKMPVGFFSLEMSREELVDRLLVSQADIDAWKLKTGRLDEDDFTSLSEGMGELAEAPLYIDDTPGQSILEMRTKARRLMADVGLKLIVVDYLQLAHAAKNYDNRVQEVSEISQGLKNLARELKIPVLALSQLSRAVEQRGTRIPQLADLRESGAIEQDADVVMFLYRENDEDLENVTLSIAKHRNGPLRSIKLRFVGNRIKFYPVDTKRKQVGL